MMPKTLLITTLCQNLLIDIEVRNCILYPKVLAFSIWKNETFFYNVHVTKLLSALTDL